MFETFLDVSTKCLEGFWGLGESRERLRAEVAPEVLIECRKYGVCVCVCYTFAKSETTLLQERTQPPRITRQTPGIESEVINFKPLPLSQR